MWAWSNTKLEAARLLSRGASVRATARAVGVHFTSVQRWKGEPAFQLGIMRTLRDGVRSRRARRVVIAGVIADHLAVQALARIGRADGAREQRILRLVLSEYRKFRAEESKSLSALTMSLGLAL